MASDSPGRIIANKYELIAPAGEGGMAVVWRAVVRRDDGTKRPIAIKRIQHAKHADPSFIRMFEEEARIGAALHHPNVVEIIDFGMDEEGGYYLVMEWIEGLDLFQWIRSYPKGQRETPWQLVAAVGVQTCRGLEAAHARTDDTGKAVPVYHRDVSPSNVLLGIDGVVKLTDFGLARAMDRASMTRPNVIKGKLAYCAPELIGGARPSAQSDLFGLGIVLWEALAQKRMFTGKNDLEVLLAVRKGDVAKLGSLRPDVPAALVDAIHVALSTSPEGRYRTAGEMATALEAVVEAANHDDVEPLGTSVRSARVRLGRPPSSDMPPKPMARPSAPPPRPSQMPPPEQSEPTLDEISFTEISANEVALSESSGEKPASSSSAELATHVLPDDEDGESSSEVEPIALTRAILRPKAKPEATERTSAIPAPSAVQPSAQQTTRASEPPASDADSFSDDGSRGDIPMPLTQKKK